VPSTADTQRVVRDNRDVLGSVGVFDLDAGPVTVMLPGADDRFLSLMFTQPGSLHVDKLRAGRARADA
jgi:hypothetical protein